MLEGMRVCAVVQKGDVSMNYGPLNGSLKGAKLGTVAFDVLSVTAASGSSGALPDGARASARPEGGVPVPETLSSRRRCRFVLGAVRHDSLKGFVLGRAQR